MINTKLKELSTLSVFESQETFNYIVRKLDNDRGTTVNTVTSDIEFLAKAMRVTNKDDLEQLRQDNWLSQTDKKEDCLRLIEFASNHIGKSMTLSLIADFKISKNDSIDKWGQLPNIAKTSFTMDDAIQYIKEHTSEMTEEYSTILYNTSKDFELERLVKKYELQ